MTSVAEPLSDLPDAAAHVLVMLLSSVACTEHDSDGGTVMYACPEYSTHINLALSAVVVGVVVAVVVTVVVGVEVTVVVGVLVCVVVAVVVGVVSTQPVNVPSWYDSIAAFSVSTTPSRFTLMIPLAVHPSADPSTVPRLYCVTARPSAPTTSIQSSRTVKSDAVGRNASTPHATSDHSVALQLRTRRSNIAAVLPHACG
jgi:hypothetical protein